MNEKEIQEELEKNIKQIIEENKAEDIAIVKSKLMEYLSKVFSIPEPRIQVDINSETNETIITVKRSPPYIDFQELNRKNV